MKYIRLSALALCGAMTLSLAACGGSSDPTPIPGATEPAVVETVEPTPTPEVSAEPTETPEATAPAESERPTESGKPAETQKPVQTPPAETTAPTPEPTQAPADDLSAADVYTKVSAVAGGNPKADMGFALTEFYNLSEDDLEDFVFYIPEMSSTNEEIFIAKVKSGKLDAVKSACESRQQGLKEEAGMYPAAAAYVETSKIATNGDWICFVVVEKPDAAVSAFNDCTK